MVGFVSSPKGIQTCLAKWVITWVVELVTSLKEWKQKQLKKSCFHLLGSYISHPENHQQPQSLIQKGPDKSHHLIHKGKISNWDGQCLYQLSRSLPTHRFSYQHRFCWVVLSEPRKQQEISPQVKQHFWWGFSWQAGDIIPTTKKIIQMIKWNDISQA